MKTEAGKKEELKIEAWLLAEKDFGSDGDTAWAKGDSLYSYRTVIARKDGMTLHVNEKRYSNTTTKLTNYVAMLAEEHGYQVSYQPEEFFNTSMREKLPGDYRDQVRNLVQKVLKDENMMKLAKDLASKSDSDAAWVKLAKLAVKEFSSDEMFNPEVLRVLAAKLKEKLGQKLLLSSYPTIESILK